MGPGLMATGVRAIKKRLPPVRDRKNRVGLSILQIGLRWVDCGFKNSAHFSVSSALPDPQGSGSQNLSIFRMNMRVE